MQDSLYREIILEHWQYPHNYGTISKPDFDNEGTNTTCGDHIHITGKIQRGKLMKVAFTAEGCAISIAAASILSDYLEGQSLSAIQAFTADQALSYLDLELTPARTRCALLSYHTLLSALPT